MNRRYSTAQYKDLVCRAREAIPGLAVTTDVIVGFPGENEEEFRSSVAFAGEMEFARMHVFPFSARPGTSAAVMPGQVPTAKKTQRVAEMCAVSRRSSLAFRGSFLGGTMDVLWENGKAERWSGLTGNYIRIWTSSVENLANRILPTRLVQVVGDGMIGELVL
jgi:threonylcarbamoyladenosine tRNA methylthiotransferase MtaB